MADTYKRFTTDDIVVGDTATVSSTVWSSNSNPLTTAWISTNTSSWEYYIPVYDKNPLTDTSATVQFSIAYGHRGGSGSIGSTTAVDSSGNTPSKAIYSQYRNLLLSSTETAFNINGSVDDIFVVNLNRARFKQKLDPGNWELRLSGSVRQQKFIDGSGAGEDPTVNAAGRVFNIYSGSGGTTASSTVYGLAYPDMGLLVFSAAISASVGFTVTRTATAATNSYAFWCTFMGSGSGTLANPAPILASARSASSGYFSARTEEKITSNYYFVRVTNQQFNYSTNSTYTSGSNGQFRWSIMQGNPQVYITTVGLYDDANQLLAIAKLSKPLLKNFNREALIKIKIDY